MFTPIDGAGLWAQPIRERKPVIVNDYSVPHPFKRGCPDGHIEIVRFLGIPAFDGDKIVALALLGNKEEDYDALDVQKVSLLLDGMWRLFERKRVEKQLEEKSNRLQEVNAALKVLLKHRDEDRKDFEEALMTNIDNLILPYLRKMKNSGPNSTSAALIEILESHLMELTSAFGRTLALQYRVLTPTEMRVATLVREGKTSKEIADILCISEKTASFHRNNIRIKLGLRGAGANLRSYLLSLT
jgi:DNA-binding CsgD family transcriptional regulator